MENQNNSTTQHQQFLLLQQFQQQRQQILQQQQQRQQIIQQNQQQQSAIARFPSNIDAHLRAPASRVSQPPAQLQNLNFQPLQKLQQNNNQKTGGSVAVRQGSSRIDVEMAQQDALGVCNPDFKRPFSSLEDAVSRLLPFHVVADYEAEEDDRMLESDTTGQAPSRLMQWDNNIMSRLQDFVGAFEKQALAFNIMNKKRVAGEFRSEERLMIEQALLQEEKQTIMRLKAEREREAAEVAKVQIAAARAEMLARSAGVADEDNGGGSREWIEKGEGREEEEQADDYLNDENEGQNGEGAVLHDQWREVGGLDLNSR